jgi:hypothetical protein
MNSHLFEPIELFWLHIMNITISNIKEKKYDEKKLFGLYQQMLSSIDKEEHDVSTKNSNKFGELTKVEYSIIKRIYNEKRSDVYLAYEGISRMCGFDNTEDCFETYTCEYE